MVRVIGDVLGLDVISNLHISNLLIIKVNFAMGGSILEFEVKDIVCIGTVNVKFSKEVQEGIIVFDPGSKVKFSGDVLCRFNSISVDENKIETIVLNLKVNEVDLMGKSTKDVFFIFK
jgi:hypothetical protein